MLRRILVLLTLVGLVVVGCGRKATPTPTSTAARTPTPISTPAAGPTSSAAGSPAPVVTPGRTLTPTSTPTFTPASTPGGTPDTQAEIRDYLNVVFPPGPGRDDLFLVCTNCHGIHLIIIAGANKTPEEWAATRTRHDTGGGKWAPQWTGRQESQDLLFDYLVKTLPPGRVLPPMPPSLITGWAVY